jgi:hypothetical protein
MANRFRDIIDYIDGGGAGQMGSQFEGGGLLSAIANQIAKPYASVDEQRRERLMQMRGLLDEPSSGGMPPLGSSNSGSLPNGMNKPIGTGNDEITLTPKFDKAAVQESMRNLQDNYMREAYGGLMPTATTPTPANVPAPPITMGGNHPGMGPSGPELMPAPSSMASGAPQSSPVRMPPVPPAGGPAMVSPSRESPPMMSETGGIAKSMDEYEEYIAELMVDVYGAEAEGRIKAEMDADPNFWQNSYNSYLQSMGLMPKPGV